MGKVQDMSWDADRKVIQGVVAGSYQNTYSVSVALMHLSVSRQASTLNLGIESVCECPVGYNCKHGAALVLQFAEERQSVARPISTLAHWRQTLSKFNPTTSVNLAADPDYCLLYTLSHRHYADHVQFGLGLAKARRLKKGGLGKPKTLRDHELTGSYNQRFMDTQDVEILQLMQALRSPFLYSSEITIKAESGGLLLQNLMKTGRFYLQNEAERPLISGPSIAPDLSWRNAKDGSKLVCSLDGVVGDWMCTPTTPAFYIDTETVRVGQIETSLPGELLNKLLKMPVLPAADARALSRDFLTDTFFQNLPPPVELDVQVIEGVTPTPRLTLMSLSAQRSSVYIAKLQMNYVGHIVAHHLLRDDTKVASGSDDREVFVTRDLEQEKTSLKKISSLGFVCVPVDDDDLQDVIAMPIADPENLISFWRDFLHGTLAQLQAENWEIVFDSSFTMRFVDADSWSLDASNANKNAEVGTGWFDVSMDIEVEGQKLALLPLLIDWLETQRGDISQRLTQQEDVWLRAAQDTFVRLPGEVLRIVLSTLVELMEERPSNEQVDMSMLRLPDVYAPLLLDLKDKLSDAGLPLGKWSLPETMDKLAHELRSFNGVKLVEKPAGLNAELRDYQLQGISWLQFLRRCGFGGVLADDMGLGKTVQVLANLLIEKNANRLSKPSLVVLPTSLISNWRRELEKFARNKLSLLILHGSDRHKLFAEINNHDLVITTYSLLSRDADVLLAHDYYYLILDESQWIKNSKTKAAKTAGELSAEHRLCVTGTPLENNLGEIWSQFNFLMPGFLGSQQTFNNRFRNPIERQGDLLRGEGLSTRLAPFILRRTKRQVAAELPDKVEMESTVSLESKQAVLYESVRASMEKRVRDVLASQGMAKSHITILDALLKLRQVCCDPRLLKLEQAKTVTQSAKLELLMNLLPEMVAEGRKVLLFSQFTSMLSLIETELEQHRIRYTKLTGATRKREEAIAEFQEGNANVFLISLKAGGVGLNLTAADTVILYDPWWNPAVERQAIDRAHRIGQDKTVFVYRLIVENSIEERIVAMQANKQQLADNLVGSNGEAIKALKAEDLLDLFRE